MSGCRVLLHCCLLSLSFGLLACTARTDPWSLHTPDGDLDLDPDNDGAYGASDNCPQIANPSQLDSDNDGRGDVCDVCPNDPNDDVDGDTVCGDIDNCATVANGAQTDSDSDGAGDACDPCVNDPLDDEDGDTLCADVDNCATIANLDQRDMDVDGIGDVCQHFAPPPCDYRIGPGWLDTPANGGDNSGSDDFIELQTLLATVSDLDSDGTITVCLGDGTTVTTVDDTTGDALRIPQDDILLMAEAGDTATLWNRRTDTAGTAMERLYVNSCVVVEDVANISLHNLHLTVDGDNGRVIYVHYGIGAGGTAHVGTLSQLTIYAESDQNHAEGIHVRGPVDQILDVHVRTVDAIGYGIETQSVGDIGSIRRTTVETTGEVASALASFVNSGAVVHDMRGVVLSTAGEFAHGIILGAGIGEGGVVGGMQYVTIKRAASATLPAHAIVVEDDCTDCYFDTARVTNNIVCNEAGSVGWTGLLGAGLYSTPITVTGVPTTPFADESVGPFGIGTFPWGDADDINNDGSNDWNLQLQWGGICP